MKNIQVICSTVILFFCSLAFKAQDSLWHRYTLVEYDCNFEANLSCLNDTIEFDSTRVWENSELGKFKVLIVLTSMMGACDVEIYDLNNNLVAKGKYSDSLGLLRKYEKRFNGSQMEIMLYAVSYYEPLKDGVWMEQNEHGEIIYKTYKKGILIE